MVLLLALVALPLAGPAVPAPSVESKQAEAAQVLAQIQSLDANLELKVEAYNAAQIELDKIAAEQRANERRLKIAKTNLGSAQGNLEARLVELYKGGTTDLVEVLLGSSSLDEILDGIETANRVSDQDTQILDEVRRFRAEVEAARGPAQGRPRAPGAGRRRARRAEERHRGPARRAAERSCPPSRTRSRSYRPRSAPRSSGWRLEARARLASQPSTGGGGGSAPAAQYGGVVGIAMQYLGIPYVWGGSSPSGFDCSGFVMYVYGQVGVSLPHNAAMQYGYGSAVSRSELAPGDLVFFNGLGHVGIYIGGNQFIHSPHTGDVVKISSLTGWYASTYYGARRL